MSILRVGKISGIDIDAPPSSLMDSTMSPNVKRTEREKISTHSLAHNTLRVEGHAGVLGWGLRRLTSNYSHGLAQPK
jgi:hypothetical protein